MARMAGFGHRLVLYGNAAGVTCHWVRIVLAIKQLDYAYRRIEHHDVRADLAELGPRTDIPTLVDHDAVLSDAAVICMYLDERHPHPGMMPTDTLGRARMRMAIAEVLRDIVPLVDGVKVGAKPTETTRRDLRERLLVSSGWFERRGRHSASAGISLLDCLLATIIWRLPVLRLDLGQTAQVLEKYGTMVFRHSGFSDSLTREERLMRQ